MATRAESETVGLERRAVGLPTAIGTTFGLIVASTVLATVTAGFFASYVFLAALAVALVVMYLQSMSFAELATMIPKAGSMNEYVRAGLGPFFATLTVLVGYIAVMLFPTTAEVVHALGDHQELPLDGRALDDVLGDRLRPLRGGAERRGDPALRRGRGRADDLRRRLAALRPDRRPRPRLDRSDRRDLPARRLHLEPLLHAPRHRDVHLRRDGVHLPARGGDGGPAATSRSGSSSGSRSSAFR